MAGDDKVPLNGVNPKPPARPRVTKASKHSFSQARLSKAVRGKKVTAVGRIARSKSKSGKTKLPVAYKKAIDALGDDLVLRLYGEIKSRRRMKQRRQVSLNGHGAEGIRTKKS